MNNKNNKKETKALIALIVIIMVMVLIITLMAIYISVNNIPTMTGKINSLHDTNENLRDLVDKKDFAWTATDMELDNLEQIIVSKDELIQELLVQVELLPLYKETLRYYNSYIGLCQTTMIFNGIEYPEFIYDTILDDGYFEELEEQVEYFEGLGD